MAFERGVWCGFEGWREWGGDGQVIGSMSRSKIADEDECTEVGLLGIEDGDLDPSLPDPAARPPACK